MKLTKIIGATLLSVSTLIFFYFLGTSQVIPLNYQLMIGGIVLLLTLLFGLLLLKSKRTIGIVIKAIIILLWSTLLGLGSYYFEKTEVFIDGLTENVGKTETYHILVRPNTYKTVEELKEKNAQLLSGETESKTEIITKLSSKTKIVVTESPSLMEGIGFLLSSQTEALFISSSYYDLLKEEDETFGDNLHLLSTIEIKLKEEIIVKDVDVQKEPFIVFISGIDTRGSISKVSRSDVNIIAIVNPLTHKILLVTTPRDYYVQLHGTKGTKDKLTHAGIYGVEKSVTTLEDLYDIDINYYLRTNFTTLIKVVDALGPIQVYSKYDFYTFAGSHIKKGYNTLNSQLALEFARTRKTIPGGDDSRGMNQEAVLEGIIKKAMDPTVLMKYAAILDALNGSFQTNMPAQDLNQLIKMQLNSPKGWSVESIAVSGTGARKPTYSMGSQLLYVTIPDENSVAYAKTKMKEIWSER